MADPIKPTPQNVPASVPAKPTFQNVPTPLDAAGQAIPPAAAPEPETEPAAASNPIPGGLILAAGTLVFEVTTDHWSTLPRGTRNDERGWGGPANVARLIGAGCLRVCA